MKKKTWNHVAEAPTILNLSQHSVAIQILIEWQVQLTENAVSLRECLTK